MARVRFEDLISRCYGRLGHNDRIILHYISQHKEEIPTMGIEDLAVKCSVSRSTVMRFAQKLGLSGFAELKTVLRWSIRLDDQVSDSIVDDLCNASINAVRSLRDTDCSAISRSLLGARRIFAYGTGNIQKAACGEFKRVLLQLGLLVNTIAGESEFRKTVGLMSPNDIVVIISETGSSQFLHDMVDDLDAKGIKIISLTSTGANYLANHASHNLFLHPESVSVGTLYPLRSHSVLFFAVMILGAKLAEYRGNKSIKDF